MAINITEDGLLVDVEQVLTNIEQKTGSSFWTELRNHVTSPENRLSIYQAITRRGLENYAFVGNNHFLDSSPDESLKVPLNLYYQFESQSFRTQAEDRLRDYYQRSLPGFLKKFISDAEIRKIIGNMVVRSQIAEQARNLQKIDSSNKECTPAKKIEGALDYPGRLTLLSYGIYEQGDFGTKEIVSGEIGQTRLTPDQLCSREFALKIIEGTTTIMEGKSRIPKGARLLAKKGFHAYDSGYLSNFPMDQLPPLGKNPLPKDYARLQSLAEKYIAAILTEAQTIIVRDSGVHEPVISCFNSCGQGVKIERIAGVYTIRGFIDSISLYR